MPDAIRLLIHAPTAEALDRARSNARNLLAARPNAQVEIVANAAGTRAAIEGPETIPGETVPVLCRNSITGQGLTPPEGVPTVEAAVLHIARRQNEGWAYMRA